MSEIQNWNVWEDEITSIDEGNMVSRGVPRVLTPAPRKIIALLPFCSLLLFAMGLRIQSHFTPD